MFYNMVSREGLAERIKRHRVAKFGRSQQALADALGDVSVFSISAYEQARSWPPPEIVEKMASLFGISLQELYTGAAPVSNDLSKREQRLLEAYRMTDEAGKADLDALAFDCILEHKRRGEHGAKREGTGLDGVRDVDG